MTEEVANFLNSVGYKKMSRHEVGIGKMVYCTSEEVYAHPDGHPFPVLKLDSKLEGSLCEITKLIASISYRQGVSDEANQRALQFVRLQSTESFIT